MQDSIADNEKGVVDVDASKDVLSAEHRDYLLTRHGTLDLVPMPSMHPVDPLNWPSWKKNLNLFLVAFHAMMTTFIAAGIIPAYELFVEDLGITLVQASYLTSVQILILGISPIFWKPIANRFGRRPVWLASTFFSMVCNIGCAESHSYAAQMVTRILVAFFISPAIAISSVVVTETFFAEHRGQKLGIWILMVTLGPPTGPFLMGFVAQHTGSWQWIYWIFAIANGVQFILYFFFSPETLFLRHHDAVSAPKVTFKETYLDFGIKGDKVITAADFINPFKLFAYPNILIPTVAYAIVFNLAGVFATVEIPQVFTPKFHFNSQQIGLQFIGIIIGTLIGEILGGRGSDMWMRRQSKNRVEGEAASPEYRLWLSYIGFATAICGLVVFTVQMDKLTSYNVTPIVGLGIAAFGNQIISTVLVTYAVDCHYEHAASIGVFVNLVRSTWGFIGPFWFPDMLSSLGLSGSGGLMAGMIVVAAVLPIMFIQWKGRALRSRKATSN